MTEIRPVRIQRTRKKGGGMKSPNGLPVVYIGRNGSKKHPNPYANPYKIGDLAYLGYDRGTVEVRSREDAILAFQVNVIPKILQEIEELRGKNVACWCSSTSKPCHGDPLLRLANGRRPGID